MRRHGRSGKGATVTVTATLLAAGLGLVDAEHALAQAPEGALRAGAAATSAASEASEPAASTASEPASSSGGASLSVSVASSGGGEGGSSSAGSSSSESSYGQTPVVQSVASGAAESEGSGSPGNGSTEAVQPAGSPPEGDPGGQPGCDPDTDPLCDIEGCARDVDESCAEPACEVVSRPCDGGGDAEPGRGEEEEGPTNREPPDEDRREPREAESVRGVIAPAVLLEPAAVTGPSEGEDRGAVTRVAAVRTEAGDALDDVELANTGFGLLLPFLLGMAMLVAGLVARQR